MLDSKRNLLLALLLVLLAASALPGRAGAAVSATEPATAGEIFSGLGFDACSAPSEAALAAWGTGSPYGAVGIYIGGVNRACSQTNLTSTWVAAESASGWHLVPIYVGLQAPDNTCGCAALTAASAGSEGTAAAADAVAQAQALGIGTGNPIYYDMEGYKRTSVVTAAVLAFLQAWTLQLHASGYESGVYSSGSSGITDLAAANTDGYTEPDDIWVADWNNLQTTIDPYIPDGFWVNGQRLHQYEGGHNESYGGVTLNIDGDYLDGATAAAGSGTPETASPTPTTAAATTTTTTTPAVPPAPTVTAAPKANGTINVTPSWKGEQGISAYRILAGNSRTALMTVATIPPSQSLPENVDGIYSYFQAQALNSSGTVLGSSPAVPTTSGIAIFGNSAFVPASGVLGVPVACVHTTPCKVRATLYDGDKRMTYTGTQTVPRHGGFVHFTLSRQAYRRVAGAGGNALPVKVVVTGTAGTKATRTLKLHAYTISGHTPKRRTGASPALEVLSRTDFVSNGEIGGVLVACVQSTPCRATTRITTAAGRALTKVRTQTLGSGQLGYLSFQMNVKGHALLRDSKGNQLAARVRVTTAPASSTTGGAAPSRSGSRTTTALSALTSFR